MYTMPKHAAAAAANTDTNDDDDKPTRKHMHIHTRRRANTYACCSRRVDDLAVVDRHNNNNNNNKDDIRVSFSFLSQCCCVYARFFWRDSIDAHFFLGVWVDLELWFCITYLVLGGRRGNVHRMDDDAAAPMCGAAAVVAVAAPSADV